MDLQPGANTVVARADGSPASLVVGVSWEAGSIEWDVCALICDSSRKVPDDDHFLFWSNPQDPRRRAFLLHSSSPHTGLEERAQVAVNLAEVGDDVDRIVVSFSTMQEGVSLRTVNGLRLRVLDVHDGSTVATFAPETRGLLETCLVLGEIYRFRDQWKFRAVGQGYQTGLAGLGTDFGVDIG